MTHLGELERVVMEYVWSEYQGADFTVRTVLAGVNRKCRRVYAYNTILTVIQHLHEKELLGRRRVGKIHHYRATVSRESFLRRLSRSLVSRLRQDYGTLALSHFADSISRVDPKLLKKAKRSL